ncbi:MAG TPA: flavin monoamine oxidase family protein [Mycobacterium sp.]|nr:flavin monoamine oxidase family protein [Mycobacterium sp.]
MAESRWSTDVVVVGAGFAGLTAARELTRSGRDVLVLEGRDRVGGRSCSGEIAGVPVDLGGTFVGPTQDAVLGLAAELGIQTAPIHHDGANLIRWRGRVRSYRGTIPKLSPLTLLDIGRVQWQFERIAGRVPLTAPWTARHARQLDSRSLADWLRSVHASAASRDLLAIAARVVWGCEPDQISMLHAARYVAAGGGLDRLLGVKDGAQQDRFVGGSQQIAQALAIQLGDRVVTGAPVRHIEWTAAGVAVHTDLGRADAASAIVAVAPAHRAGIAFAPALPDVHRRLARVWPQGRLSKAFAAYPTPFWRADGRSGEALSDTGSVSITFDVSPQPAGPGILLGFVHAGGFDTLPAEQRRRLVLADFAALFGADALQPIDYLDHCWGTDEFADGGPTAAVPPGSWTDYGRWLRKPVGPIHWAGTETADEWTGFLDGAVRSGQRAAAEVTAQARN